MTHVIHEKIKPGQVYRHYKGNNYKIIVLGKHSETGEELVAYQRLEDGHVYFRPIEMFFEDVEWEGKKATRFTLASIDTNEESLKERVQRLNEEKQLKIKELESRFDPIEFAQLSESEKFTLRMDELFGEYSRKNKEK